MDPRCDCVKHATRGSEKSGRVTMVSTLWTHVQLSQSSLDRLRPRGRARLRSNENDHGYGYVRVHGDLYESSKKRSSNVPSNLPCTTRALTILRPSPTHPTMRMDTGWSIGSTCTKRSMDCKKMERARARRNTPLKKAPAGSRSQATVHRFGRAL